MALPLIAGAAIVGGALINAYGANKAAQVSAKEAAATARRNAATARATGVKQEALTKPWIQGGMTAMGKIQDYANDPKNFANNNYTGPTQFDPNSVDVTKDPGYQFRLQQGVEALDNSAAQKGSLHSGAQQKALLEYGQNLGAQEYAAAYKRAEDTMAGNFQRGFNVNQDTNAQTVANRAALLNAQGGLMNTGFGAMTSQNTNLTGLASATMGASNQAGAAAAASGAAPWQAMSNMGGTLSSTALNLAPYAFGTPKKAE